VNSVIVDENIFNVRVDIPTTLDVRLVANDKACCIRNPNPGPQGVCALLSGACSETGAADLAINIGGNFGAPAAPEGYQYPGAPAMFPTAPMRARSASSASSAPERPSITTNSSIPTMAALPGT
jgi:hypothetical protein